MACNGRFCIAISTHAPAGGATGFQLKTADKGKDFYSRPCGRGDCSKNQHGIMNKQFLLTPLREGRPTREFTSSIFGVFLLTPLREGRLEPSHACHGAERFLLTPLREGRPEAHTGKLHRSSHFYSRPCGRGDKILLPDLPCTGHISTHAPAGGATWTRDRPSGIVRFLLTPLREGRPTPC